MNIAVIPARAGSRRIPGKNTRLFHGKPILAYSIETARASGCFQKIVVSTEDAGVAAIAKAYGAKVHQRPVHLADDKVGTQEVMRAALIWWASCTGQVPEFACCIYATAPLLLPEDLRRGLDMLRHSTEPYVFSVGELLEDRGSRVIGAVGHVRGAFLPVDAGAWYWGRPKAFIESVPLEGHAKHYHMPPARVCDINTESDWQEAERLYSLLYSA